MDHLSSTPEEVEEYLGLKSGVFDHIPHYARESALICIQNVRRMEQEQMFRPGLYYIIMSDLCRSTEASAKLGQDLNRLRVETFILICIEALGAIPLNNYFLPLREIGDAVLIVFSSFKDAHSWWYTMHEFLDTQNRLWQEELNAYQFRTFSLDAKTVIHAGEVAYSGGNIPIANAVNQTFKIEKDFKPGELGITHIAALAAKPVLISLELNLKSRGEVVLPGDKESTRIYVVDKWKA